MTNTDGENSPKNYSITNSSILWAVQTFSHDSVVIDDRDTWKWCELWRVADPFFHYYGCNRSVRRKPAAFMYEISILLLNLSIKLTLSVNIGFTAECVNHCWLILQRPKVFQGWRIILFESKCWCSREDIGPVQAHMQATCSCFYLGSRRAFESFI